jgi:hypothetical protein
VALGRGAADDARFILDLGATEEPKYEHDQPLTKN